jgi:beta-phosphoglucomutase
VQDGGIMKYKAVIYDLDGVIVHTDHYHYLAWKFVADQLHLQFDEALNNKLRGVSRMESLNIILDSNAVKLSETEKEEIAKEKNEVYKKYLMKMTPRDIDEAVRLTLHELRNNKIKLAIGSSSRNAKMILERTGIVDLFDAISDGNNITHSKPDPEVFLKAAEYMNLKPEECLVVEDAVAGINAGIAGGFDTAAIGDAARYDKATYKLDRLSDLLKILADN